MTRAFSGPKHRTDVRRYKDGSIAREDRGLSADDAKAPVLEARMRQEWGVDAWLSARGSGKNMVEARRRLDDPLRGYALGRLLLQGRKDAAGGITQAQHDAGGYFEYLYRIECRRNGTPSPNARSVNADMVSRGLSTHAEDSPEWIADMQRHWLNLYREIYDLREWEAVYSALRRIIVEDQMPESLEEVGALRTGLNAINRMRGIRA